jgi:putative DNA primase/helicase
MSMEMRVKFPCHLGVVVDPITENTVEALPFGQSSISLSVLEATLPDWRTKPGRGGALTKTTPLNTATNVSAVAGLCGWTLRYNEMTKRVESTKRGVVIPEDDHENTSLTLLGDDVVRAGMSRADLGALVDSVATANRYHPVRDWINSVPWDGVSRRSIWHQTLVLANPRKAEYRAKLMDRWALQCVGALEEPLGISSPGFLVLCGPQHTGKTYWYLHLCPVQEAIGTGVTLDPSSKDSVLRVIRCWIVELGELDSTTRRADVSMLKAFTSNDVDVVRLPYARRDTSYRRRTVLGGTVNGSGFLVDETGNRRFWVLDVVSCNVLPPEIMQQVWAEYMTMYRAGERWHLDVQTLAELNSSNLDHTAVDPLRERITTGLDWGSVDWSTIDPSNYQAFPQVGWLTATDLCIKVGIERPTKAESTRAGGIVRDLHRVSAGGKQGNLERKSNGVKLLAVPRYAQPWQPQVQIAQNAG